MSQRLFDFDPATHRLLSVPGSIEQYPGGDVAVRNLRPAGDGYIPVYWNSGGTLDYASVAQWDAFHRRHGADPVLVTPYLPSARGDHDATYDAQGVARLTAATGVRHLIAADPHSSAWGDSAADWGLTVHAISAASIIRTSPLAGMVWDGVIAPDKGAVDRAGEVARMFGVAMLTAGKVRDPKTGKLSGFTAPEGLVGRYLVVDDICDGGGTFAGMAQVLHETSPRAQVHLWTTHGLFTGRWHENLMPNFDTITAASTQPSPNPVAVPHEITWTALWPHVIDELARLHAASMAA